MGVELLISSVQKIITPEPVEIGLLPAAILIVSIAVKVYMSAYNRSVGKKISSSAMLATATDSLSDSIATTVVLISMGVSYFFDVNIDGYAGVLVALFILWAGIGDALSKECEVELCTRGRNLPHTPLMGPAFRSGQGRNRPGTWRCRR